MAVPRELAQAWGPHAPGGGATAVGEAAGASPTAVVGSIGPDIAPQRTRAADHLAKASELVRGAVLAVEELRSAGVPAASVDDLNEAGYALHRAGVALDNLSKRSALHLQP